MELALYDRELGYYARAAQRSGRAGDFFTSVDVGPVFGELLEIQIAEMADILDGQSDGVGAELARPFDSPVAQPPDRVEADPARPPRCVLVEAGTGNARLAADIPR